MELPKRKNTRLRGYDYNTPGCYFITICTKDKQKILCEIVGTGVLDGPDTAFSAYGRTVCERLEFMSTFYEDIRIEKYAVMPNHVHMLIRLPEKSGGPSGRPVPTDSRIACFVGAFKRFTNRECGRDLWQSRSYDHIVRDEADYLKIWEYIENNPVRWKEDRFYE